MMKRLVLTGIIALTMAFALTLMGCPTSTDDDDDGSGGGNGALAITPASTALEVVWPQEGSLATAADYHVRYKEAANAGVTGSTAVAAGNINRATAASFKADITGLTNGTAYRVWVFRNTDAATYTSAAPLYTGMGTPVAPTQVTLAGKSQGTAAANSVTGLDTAAKYVVQDGTTQNWHPVANDGTLGNGGTIDAAITATISGLGTIRDLSNSRTYDVVLVKVFADSGALTLADISKNIAADISALTATKTLNISSTGGNAATLYVYTGQANDAGIAGTIAANNRFGAAAGKEYLITDATSVGSIQLAANAGERHATIDLTSNTPAGASITITVQ
jgi:uncharacterized lipoprotein NlpE involved in copper resistance